MPRWGGRCRPGLLGLCVGFAVTLTATASASSNEALAVIQFELVNSRVVIPVSINGSPPLDFVFDNASGGTVVHSSTAEALGLGGSTSVVVGEDVAVSGDAPFVVGEASTTPEGAVRIVDGQIILGDAEVVQIESDHADTAGLIQMEVETMQVAGAGSTHAVYFVAGSSGVVMGGHSSMAELTLGEMALGDFELSVLPLTHLTMPSGEPIDGIIGYDILKSFVVEVDYDADMLRVFDRDTYIPADGAVPHDVVFLLGNVAQPCVSGEITIPGGDVVSGMFVLDAGAGADVVLNSPFVRDHDLVSRLGAADSPTDSASGVTPDETPVVKSTLPGFTFCGFSLGAVPVTLNLGTSGFLASEGYAGVIGNRVLSRYNITYDYAGEVVYLEPVSGS